MRRRLPVNAVAGAWVSPPVRVGLIGAGGIGSFHGESFTLRVPGATLASMADPAPGVAERLAASLGCPQATLEPAELLADPSIQAVVIAAPPTLHGQLFQARAGRGQGGFREEREAAGAAGGVPPTQGGTHHRG